MYSFFYAFIVFLLNMNICFGAADKLCSCYDSPNSYYISSWLNKFTQKAEQLYLWTTPPYRERWEAPYHAEFKHHLSLYPDSRSRRYPDVYQRILLFEERIDILGNFWIAIWRDHYLIDKSCFWGHTQSEREVMFAENRDFTLSQMSTCKEVLRECSHEITKVYIDLFEGCLKKNHNCLVTLHDYGMFAYLNNNLDKSFELLSELIEKAEESGELDKINAAVYHNLGSVCSEAMAYDKAIEYLSESIRLNPENKEACFERALAYFETGEFGMALDDYILAEMKFNNSLEQFS